MPENLLNLSEGLSNNDLQKTTAVESDVLNGKSFYSGNKNLKAGSMKSHGDGTECNSIGINGNNIYVRIDPGAYLQTAPASGYPEIICDIDSVKDVIGRGRVRVVLEARLGTAGSTPYGHADAYIFNADTGAQIGHTWTESRAMNGGPATSETTCNM